MSTAAAGPAEPPADCALCPRLVAFRAANRAARPDAFNAPVPSFGATDARLLIVGLAPGLGGANRTGRPFTGDGAGDFLFAALDRAGFSRGGYGRRADDGLELVGCRICNAVRCVPPANKPVAAELAACRAFLAAEIAGLPRLAALLALGRLAHDQVLAVAGHRRAAMPFGHGARHMLRPGLVLFDSYHCSRQNTNTGRLTPAMFDDVLSALREALADG